jgi:hypothetical protein
MKYSNLTFKKIAGLTGILLLLGVIVSGTAIGWEKSVGTFSIPNVELALANNASAWRNRLAYNSQFGSPPFNGLQSALAMIGFAPPLTQASAGESSTAQSIPVLVYHGISPTSDTPEVTTIDTFRSQMFALKHAGWQTVNIEDFLAAMQGKKVLPAKSLLLTFDDGRQDAYLNATPILQSLGYQAVMYIITGHSLATGNEKSKYYATKTQLEQMVNSGVWELQAHSAIAHTQYPIDATGDVGDFYGHRLWIPTPDTGESSSTYTTRIHADLESFFQKGTLYALTPGRLETLPEYEARVATDLLQSKTDLEKLGVNVVSFAYPYNDFAKDLETDTANGKPGLIYFVNQIYPISFFQWYPSLGFSQDYPSNETQLLRRIEPKPNWTPDYLLTFLNQGLPKSLPYQLPTTDDGSWRQAWGNVVASNGTISLAAASGTAGSASILDGTRLWENYTFDTHFNWQNADSISLFTNYQAAPEATNYLACNFGNGTVRLEDHENGQLNILARATNPIITPGDNKNAGVKIAAHYAECLWNDAVMAGAAIPASAPASGGVGIEIWDHQMGTAQAMVTGVTVQ